MEKELFFFEFTSIFSIHNLVTKSKARTEGIFVQSFTFDLVLIRELSEL